MNGWRKQPLQGGTIGTTGPAKLTATPILKTCLIGHEVTIPITAGRCDFGPWQQVYYAEFDGRRKKRVIVKVMGE